MKKIFLLLTLLSTLISSDFLSIDTFVAMHPDQKVKMEAFDALVQDEPSKIATKQKEAIKIAIIYPQETSDYWQRSKKSFKRRLDLLDINYTIDEYFIDLSNLMQQKKALKQVLQENNDYLIFTLNVDIHEKFINQILSRKKPKLIIQNLTTPLVQWEGNQPFLYVGFDHLEGTKLLANYLKTRFPHGANYAMLYFKEGFVSQMRGDGFISLMDSSFTLKDSFYTQGKIQEATLATQKILEEHPNVDFIYSCATDVSLGALKAMQNLQNPPLLNGWGGGAKELELIKEKKLTFTVMRMNDDNGVAMAEAIKLDLENKTQQVPQIYSGKFMLIDEKTDAEIFEAYKKRAFRYSGL
ncbi:MAG: substrate-binding domain-containing protein [Sulfurospirillum sp.]|nr:substrate-binding domain-containing protein [Sulfurospirillum sp.]